MELLTFLVVIFVFKSINVASLSVSIVLRESNEFSKAQALQTLASFRQYNSTNMLHSIDLLVLTQNGLLQLVTRTRSSLQVRNNTQTLFISLLRKQDADLAIHAVSKNTENFLNIDQGSCAMEIKPAGNKVKQCQIISQHITPTLAVLFDRLIIKNILIISSMDACYNSTAKNLLSELKASVEAGKITGLQIKTLSLPKVFTADTLTKLLSTSLKERLHAIILNAGKDMQDLVLRVAAKLDSKANKFLWILLWQGEIVNLPETYSARTLHLKRTITHQRPKLIPSDILIKVLLQLEMTPGDPNGQWLHSFSSQLFPVSCSKEALEHITVNLLFKSSASQYLFTFDKTGKILREGVVPNSLIQSTASERPLFKIRVMTTIEPPLVHGFPYLYNAEDKVCEVGVPCWKPLPSGPADYSCCSGLLVDFLEQLKLLAGFEYDLLVSPDGFYGTRINNEWNGLVREILDNKADLAGPLTINRERSNAIAFTEHFMETSIGVAWNAFHTHDDDNIFLNFDFANVVTNNLLFVLFGTFICCIVVVYIFENVQFTAKVPTLSSEEMSNAFPYSLLEGFSYFAGALFQTDIGGKIPESISSKLFVVSFAFGMTIAMNTYIAVTTASHVSHDKHFVFEGLKDEKMLNPSNAFRFATVANSSLIPLFRDSNRDEFRRMHFFMKQYNVKHSTEGFLKLQAKELEAFIYDEPYVRFELSKQKVCKLLYRAEDIAKAGYGFGVRKDYPLTAIVSHAIRQLKQKEAYTYLFAKWFPSLCTQVENVKVEKKRLNWDYFGGMIAILISAVGISLLVLASEVLWRYITQHMKNKIIETKVSPNRELPTTVIRVKEKSSNAEDR